MFHLFLVAVFLRSDEMKTEEWTVSASKNTANELYLLYFKINELSFNKPSQ